MWIDNCEQQTTDDRVTCCHHKSSHMHEHFVLRMSVIGIKSLIMEINKPSSKNNNYYNLDFFQNMSPYKKILQQTLTTDTTMCFNQLFVFIHLYSQQLTL
jgi:hypothetical protein